ncbi:hypothetical protein PVAND_004356 [Polypedilum vanderplanki]|uniref:Uncharacterized protein n=1 Tax=Polypedilum vanderplanki TaxID=319348 RepID=A0A9J6BYX1_POLVA|nr:hypothetical protein PVAND_004356 [Polypedilum vanderplanki]
MTFVPLYRDRKHKFENGYWTWNDENGLKLKFYSHESEAVELLRKQDRKQQTSVLSIVVDEGKMKASDKQRKNHCDSSDVGLKFVNHIDEDEEKIFLQFFQRPNLSDTIDNDVITLQDVKNLSLFTLKTRITKDFSDFLHTLLFDEFFHAAVFYIDIFLMILELLLIKRDELSDGNVLLNKRSLNVERCLSQRLSDR